MIDSRGDKVKLVIRRLRCERCKRIHHELPDCIVPYKRHCRETIEAVIRGNRDVVPCSDGTMRRIIIWWKMVAEYYKNVLKSLEEKHKVKFGNPPAFKEIVRAVVNTHSWISPGKDCTRTGLADP